MSERRDTQLEALRLILQSSKLESMRRIYERTAPGPDGRLRTALSAVVTETGRLGSRETFLEPGSTNLQNIPKKTAKLDPLYDIRSVMIPDPGMVLVEGDYSQIESRLTAAFACDTATLDLYDDPSQDIHRKTAAAIFGVDEADVTWEQRHLGKMRRHAFNYGQSWKGFMESINADSDLTGVTLSAARSKEIDQSFRDVNPKLLEWQREVVEEVRRNGRLTNPYGRTKIFVDLSDSAMNAALAYLPQSTAADHVNTALVKVWKEIVARRLRADLLLQIHDAILLQAPKGSWKQAARLLKVIMEGSGVVIEGRRITTPVDVSISETSWAQMEEVEV